MRTRGFACLIGASLAVGLATTLLAAGAGAAARPGVPGLSVHVVRGGSVAVHRPWHVLPGKQARALIAKALHGRRFLQDSRSGVFCYGGGAVSSNSADQNQTCTISSGSVAICIERSTNPTAAQTCTITQAGAGRTNVAIAVQVIVQRDFGPSGSQGGKQTINISQSNTTGSNLAFVAQLIKQSLGIGADNSDGEEAAQQQAQQAATIQGILPNFLPLVSGLQGVEQAQEGDEPATAPTFAGTVLQDQQSQQNANVCQGGPGDTLVDCHHPLSGMTGNNLSSVYQSLRQRERAANAATIGQSQNKMATTPCIGSMDNFNPNMCAVVDQNTTGGKNGSNLDQLYRQFQSAANAPSGNQKQDAGIDQGGFDHTIHQTSGGGVETITTDQRAHQVQRADNIPMLFQDQDPRGSKGVGSTQTGSMFDTWRGSMISSQLQTRDGMPTIGARAQNQFLTYDGFTTGDIRATITGSSNGSTATVQCPSSASTAPNPSCSIAVQCFSGEGGPAFCTPFTPGNTTILGRPTG